MKQDKTKYKNNLREFRTSAGVSVAKLSEAAGVSADLIRKVERLSIDPFWEEKSRIVLALNRVGNVKHSPEEVFPIQEEAKAANWRIYETDVYSVTL